MIFDPVRLFKHPLTDQCPNLVRQRWAVVEDVVGRLPHFVDKIQQKGKQKETGFWRRQDAN
jgi:hypothetical protein